MTNAVHALAVATSRRTGGGGGGASQTAPAIEFAPPTYATLCLPVLYSAEDVAAAGGASIAHDDFALLAGAASLFPPITTAEGGPWSGDGWAGTPWQVAEMLKFADSPLPLLHHGVATFTATRVTRFNAVACRVALFAGETAAGRPQYSLLGAASVDSNWQIVLLQLRSVVVVDAAAQVVVRSTCDYADIHPRYTFRIELGKGELLRAIEIGNVHPRVFCV